VAVRWDETHKVVLPSNTPQRKRTDLREESAHKPIADASRERCSTTTNLHGHDLAHVDPADGAEGQREDDGDQEDEEHAADGEAVLVSCRVLGVKGRFADQGDSDAYSAEQEGLLAAYAVEDEEDED